MAINVHLQGQVIGIFTNFIVLKDCSSPYSSLIKDEQIVYIENKKDMQINDVIKLDAIAIRCSICYHDINQYDAWKAYTFIKVTQ